MVAPHLSPRVIAKSLDVLRAWPASSEDDPAALHRCALRALLATEELAGLELPVDLQAPAQSDPMEVEQWEVVTRLLAQAEGTLRGAAHRQHIDRLCRVLPGHALQLARRGTAAAERLRALRERVDFIRDGNGAVDVAEEPMFAHGPSLPQ